MSPTRARSGALLALLLCLSAEAHADGPSLPGGWVHGSTGRLDRPTDRFTTDRFSVLGQRETPFIQESRAISRRVDPTTLPEFDVEPEDKSVPTTLPAGDAAEVVVLKKQRVSLQGFEAAILSIGKERDAVGRQAEGGLSNMCGTSAKTAPISPLHYEAVRRIDTKGTLEFVIADGFLDRASCRAVVTKRLRVVPKTFGDSALFGFRTRCASCEPGKRTMLHLLSPQDNFDALDKPLPFQHRSLPLDPGTSGRTLIATSFKTPGGHGGLGGGWFSGVGGNVAFTMPDWEGFSSRVCGEEKTWCSVSVRVDVLRGAKDPQATVVVSGRP